MIDASTNTMYLVVETSILGRQGTPFFLHALDVTTGLDRGVAPYRSTRLTTETFWRLRATSEWAWR